MYSLQIFKGKDLKAKSMEELARLFGKSGIYYYNVVRGIHHKIKKPKDHFGLFSIKTLMPD
jgi:DNA polymerase-4